MRHIWPRFFHKIAYFLPKHRPETYGINFQDWITSSFWIIALGFCSGTAKGQSSQAIELGKDGLLFEGVAYSRISTSIRSHSIPVMLLVLLNAWTFAARHDPICLVSPPTDESCALEVDALSNFGGEQLYSRLGCCIEFLWTKDVQKYSVQLVGVRSETNKSTGSKVSEELRTGRYQN